MYPGPCAHHFRLYQAMVWLAVVPSGYPFQLLLGGSQQELLSRTVRQEEDEERKGLAMQM